MKPEKQTWPAITKVSLFEEIPDVLNKMPRSLDRLNASRYFLASTPSLEDKTIDESLLQNLRWQAWAAIASLPSPASNDIVEKDLADLGLAVAWNQTRAREKIYADPLIAMFLELRNFNIHVKVIEVQNRNFTSKMMRNDKVEEIDFGQHVFLQAIDFNELKATRNIKSGLSSLTPLTTDWFNSQAETWPITYLLGEARERYMTLLAEFIRSDRFRLGSTPD